ncbi:MAG: transcriptional regulator [Deltaproteobacteria bacterium]|nr:transcriptional regulator [Deltaproteobacteria bacterium]
MSTIRREIIALLGDNELNALEISQALSIREKEVYEHLDHINRTLTAQGKRLLVRPYTCLGCGFSFADRHRFNRPGRCPRCKGGHIRMASYFIQQ